MSFEVRAAELRANTVNSNTVTANSSDIYSELILQELESIDNKSNLNDTINTQFLTNSAVELTNSGTCKYVTLSNLTTNNSVFIRLEGDSQEFTLEPGYSLRLNVYNAQLIQVRQATETGQVIQYIVTY